MGKKEVFHNCKVRRYTNKITGEIVHGPENIWECPACAEKKVRDLVARVGDKPWDYFITLTTKDYFFRPPTNRIWKLKAKFKAFLDAIEYKYGVIAYLWAIGTTDDGKIHFHILWRGPKPDEKWLSRKWHRYTGSYIVDIRDAKPGHVAYTFWNAARLPHIHGDRSVFYLYWQRREMRNFRRYGASKGIIAPRQKKAASDWKMLGSEERKWRKPYRFPEPPMPTQGI